MSTSRFKQRPVATKRPQKATDLKVTKGFLDERHKRVEALGYNKQKWVQFCEIMLEKGFVLTLYEARRTFSKYITVRDENRATFKVRFSNHKPIPQREANGDCDFFVGVTNSGVSTWRDAVYATLKYFGKVQS